jgi:hypothetical protein
MKEKPLLKLLFRIITFFTRFKMKRSIQCVICLNILQNQNLTQLILCVFSYIYIYIYIYKKNYKF